MDLTNQDEIEYFGFLAVSFTTDLREELNEGLNEIFQNNRLPQKIQLHINESFRKNFFIFNNFVLRNILKFPNNFHLERKVTDKTIEADVSLIVKGLLEKQQSIIHLKKNLVNLKNKIIEQENRRDGYLKLLENKEKFEEMCAGAKTMKLFLKETNNMFEKYKISVKRKDGEFEKLMEYKNLKSEYYKSERQKLIDICDFDVLEHFNRCL